MTQLAATAVIPAPLRVPTSVGSLLVSSNEITDGTERWMAGFHYCPEGPAHAEVMRLACDNLGEGEKTAVTGVGPENSWIPYVLIASDRASSFGFQLHDYRARATRQLMIMESKLIEHEFWTAAIEPTNFDTATDGQGGLASDPNATVLGGGAVTAAKALAYMEQGIADANSGRMMIHMRPFLFYRLLESSAGGIDLHREGNRWLTALDNVVVPGWGYPGTGPAGQAVGATEWMHATGMVDIRRGEINVLPDNMAQATDRLTNTVTFYAERLALASFDDSIPHLALQVTT